MNKVFAGLLFTILLVIAYVAGYTVGAVTGWALGFEGLGLHILATLIGATFAGDFVGHVTSI